MSDLHDQALSDPSYEKRGVEAGRKNARRPLRHGDPDGTSVFDHGDRKRGPSDRGEFAGVHGGCGCLHGKQGQHVFLLSV